MALNDAGRWQKQAAAPALGRRRAANQSGPFCGSLPKCTGLTPTARSSLSCGPSFDFQVAVSGQSLTHLQIKMTKGHDMNFRIWEPSARLRFWPGLPGADYQPDHLATPTTFMTGSSDSKYDGPCAVEDNTAGDCFGGSGPSGDSTGKGGVQDNNRFLGGWRRPVPGTAVLHAVLQRHD